MFILEPAVLTALAAFMSALATLIWSIRRKP